MRVYSTSSSPLFQAAAPPTTHSCRLFWLLFRTDHLSSLLWSRENKAENWNWQHPGFTHPSAVNPWRAAIGPTWVRCPAPDPSRAARVTLSQSFLCFQRCLVRGKEAEEFQEKKVWLDSRWPMDLESWEKSFPWTLRSEKKDNVGHWRKAGYGSEGNKLSVGSKNRHYVCFQSSLGGRRAGVAYCSGNCLIISCYTDFPIWKWWGYTGCKIHSLSVSLSLKED